ncbi:MAG TPA: MarR family transcriptional regulator [Candidatus Dormibacteraeota bacterium]|jgi:hypothetical protein|nr:MarR family transcriptional regulator [Candidatus Dormibacteraeota bacterium]
MPAPADEHLALVLDADLRLLAITERLRQHWSVHATALGLTPAQVKVLLRLSPGEATPMRKLARQLDRDASNLTTIVDRLAGRGALEGQADPADGASRPSCSPSRASACAIGSGAASPATQGRSPHSARVTCSP